MTKTRTEKINETLLESFSLVWEMYKDVLRSVEESQWRQGEIDYLVPSRLMLHSIETIDFYSSRSPKEFNHGYRFNIDRKTATLEELPTREQLKEYLDEVKEKCMSWLIKTDDPEYLSPETEFPWTGSNVLGRVLYLLSHCRQHLGELNAELRRRGLERIKWRTF
jgi:hypothetical protein